MSYDQVTNARMPYIRSINNVSLWVILNMSGRPTIYLKSIFDKTIVLSFALSCVVSLSSCHIELQTSTDHLVNGREYFKANDYKRAEVEFKKALELEPNSPTVKATATNNLGVIYNEQGRYDEAIKVLKEATTVDPKNAIAHYVLANALTKVGRFDDALAEAQASTELDKTEPGAYRALAEAAMGKGDVPLAISAYRYAIGLESGNELLHHKLALALGQIQDWEGQIAEERSALELNPDNVEARLALAVALHNSGEPDSAVSELKTVLKKDVNNAEAKRLLEAFAHEGKASKTSNRLFETPTGQIKSKM